MNARPLYWFFDYVSPYSYLASKHIQNDDFLLSLPLLSSPIAFGTILSHRNLAGAGEDPRQRELGLMDVLMLSDRFGYALKAPPRHPFNPLYALRSTFAVRDPRKRLELTFTYFRLCWQDGLSLEDMAVLRQGLGEVGIEQDPEAAASDGNNRNGVKALTRFAIEVGVKGVPSFLIDDDLVFFGQDRIDLLKAYLRGDVQLDRQLLAELMSRPGADRVT
jgi:2-hydroxychromene-2-carboxylate isomerase